MSDLSALWRFKLKDFVHSALSAVVAGVLISLGQIVLQGNFDLFTVDWASVGHTAVNAGFAAFVGFLGVKFGTNGQGKVFGRL